MDWTKAKTILIIAFIITNVFLFYNLEKDKPSAESYSSLTEERLEDVKEILSERGVSLLSEIPREMPEVASLEVAYLQMDKYEQARVFLGDKFNSKDEAFSKAGESLKVLEGKKLIYENTQTINSYEIGLDEARESAELFLKEKGISLDDAVLETISAENGLVRLVYVQTAENLPFENGQMEILLSGDKVVRLERIWMQVIAVGDSKRKVIPATKALLMALKTLEEKRITEIEELTLTYLFDTKKSSLSKWQDIKSGTALPVWRLDLPNESGSIYIDAYEGIVISD